MVISSFVKYTLQTRLEAKDTHINKRLLKNTETDFNSSKMSICKSILTTKMMASKFEKVVAVVALGYFSYDLFTAIKEMVSHSWGRKINSAVEQLFNDVNGVIPPKRVEYMIEKIKVFGITLPEQLNYSVNDQNTDVQVYMPNAIARKTPHLTWWYEYNSNGHFTGAISGVAKDGSLRYQFENWREGDKFICELRVTDMDASKE